MDIQNSLCRNVKVAIRPEGFIPSDDGCLSCTLSGVEVMGRDVSIISMNSCCENKKIRSIISAETKIDTTKSVIRFNLKLSKVFIFDSETGKRILF